MCIDIRTTCAIRHGLWSVHSMSMQHAPWPTRATIDMCIDMCIDMRIDIRMDVCMDMCIDMCTDMCIDMFVDMCVDMCMDICIDMCKHMSIRTTLAAARASYCSFPGRSSFGQGEAVSWV